MADIADRAEGELALLDRLTNIAIDNARLSFSPTIGPLFCACGEEIPSGRRKLGLRCCIDCARRAEAQR